MRITPRKSMRISEEIKNSILKSSASFHANDNISDFVMQKDMEDLIGDVSSIVYDLLSALIIDIDRDHNTKDTPKRIAKMFVNEIFSGRYLPCPEIKEFPNAKQLDQIYTIGPITINSTCSHHFVPITGKAWLGIIPGENVIGLSKFKRLADWIMCRPQIQEEATVQLADLIEEKIKPRALALVVNATHHCMTSRGIKETSTSMTTSVMRGIFLDNQAARQEFLALIGNQK